MIEVRNVSYSYQDSAALKDINLVIPDGLTVALIGHTGSGKSTLAEHLNGLLRPDSGEIIIDGRNIRDLKVKDICKKVGLVFQYPEKQLFEETVYEDIAFGPKNLGLSEEKIKECVLSAAEMTGLNEDSLNKSPFELSGGQMRRAAIAGVLAMRPKILILDEVMEGLDPKGKRSVMEMIKRLRSENKDMTVIFVSHSMEDAAVLADKIIVMNEGRIEMYADVSEVFSNEERLVKIGLGIPQITSVMRKLREKGYDVSGDIYSVQSAATEIKAFLAGDNNA